MQSEMELLKKQLKKDIIFLIEENYLNDAKALIQQYKSIIASYDIDIVIMDANILVKENNFYNAERILKQALSLECNSFELNYNLAYVLKNEGKFNESLKYYNESKKYCCDDNMILKINNIINDIKEKHKEYINEKRKKLIFFSKGDDKFIYDIINELSEEYDTRKITVTNHEQIEEGMKWADICWFEWCDEIIGHASKLGLAEKKKIICRIHGYEVYTDFIRNVKWDNVDELIIVAPHIRRLFEEFTSDLDKKKLKIRDIFCGINVNAYPLNIKKKGFNLGYLGYINFKKNIPLTLDIFKKLHDIDKRYRLYFAGEIQDCRTAAYINYFVKEHNLSQNIQFDGWQDNEHKIQWFKKIDYMVISSIDEGLCFAAAESMCSGVKPILHNCEGIKDHYDKKYIFSTLDEAVEMIMSEDYESEEYRNFIKKKYSLNREYEQIKRIIKDLEN